MNINPSLINARSTVIYLFCISQKNHIEISDCWLNNDADGNGGGDRLDITNF